ncbi:hypothetical protein H2201_000170 [Coniosporium apollinis]|uniref:Ribosomal protein S21 n=1 Tax=Coniosporium apollinis TaxID=61459 RepID=A0ABQ9P5K4_9PEZI|nr:hypothetical protein H2201_000170 [Coniosporium apollinis]
MELRRAGEALLRNHPTALLAPSSISSRVCRRTHFASSTPWSQPGAIVSPFSTHRPFSTTLPRTQQAAARAPDPPPAREPQHQPSSLESALDSALDFSSTTPTSQHRTSRFKTPSAQATHRTETHPGSRHNVTPSPSNTGSGSASTSTSSFDDLLGALIPRSPAPASRRPAPYTPRSRDPVPNTLDLGRMLDPLSTSSSLNPPPAAEVKRIPDPSPFRLGPSLGRTVNVDASKGVDLARGLRQLEMLCGRNRVRQDEARQRFHERPGLKRKRLRRERWRRRFKEGFQAVVGRVQELRRKGW